jgi:hypothetical protein
MHYKTIFSGLLVAVTFCGVFAAQDGADDFFKCAFLSRAETALIAAGNGDLTEDMVNDLTPEDRDKLMSGINARTVALQAELLTAGQQNWHTAGRYIAGATSLVGGLGYLYSSFNFVVDFEAWMVTSRRAAKSQELGLAGFDGESQLAAAFKWDAGKAALVLTGAVATYLVGAFGYDYIQGLAAQHDAAVAELENLKAALELVNVTPVTI